MINHPLDRNVFARPQSTTDGGFIWHTLVMKKTEHSYYEVTRNISKTILTNSEKSHALTQVADAGNEGNYRQEKHEKKQVISL